MVELSIVFLIVQAFLWSFKFEPWKPFSQRVAKQATWVLYTKWIKWPPKGTHTYTAQSHSLYVGSMSALTKQILNLCKELALRRVSLGLNCLYFSLQLYKALVIQSERCVYVWDDSSAKHTMPESDATRGNKKGRCLIETAPYLKGHWSGCPFIIIFSKSGERTQWAAQCSSYIQSMTSTLGGSNKSCFTHHWLIHEGQWWFQH